MNKDLKGFQNFVRENEGLILSDGTLDLNHLLSKAYDLINSYGLDDRHLMLEIEKLFAFKEGYEMELSLVSHVYHNECEIRDEHLYEANEIWNEDIFYFFNEIAPNGYYFGSSEGDGALIGWFEYKEEF